MQSNTLNMKLNRSATQIAIKTAHTVVWLFFVICIAGIPVASWRGEFRVAGWLIASLTRLQAKPYFDRLKAPVKGFYTFENSAHSPHREEPERVQETLAADVLNGTAGQITFQSPDARKYRYFADDRKGRDCSTSRP